MGHDRNTISQTEQIEVASRRQEPAGGEVDDAHGTKWPAAGLRAPGGDSSMNDPIAKGDDCTWAIPHGRHKGTVIDVWVTMVYDDGTVALGTDADLDLFPNPLWFIGVPVSDLTRIEVAS